MRPALTSFSEPIIILVCVAHTFLTNSADRATLCAVSTTGSSNPPGRGGPWWNDPTYWIGLLLGVGLAYPLINRFILNGTSDKEKVRGADSNMVPWSVHWLEFHTILQCDSWEHFCIGLGFKLCDACCAVVSDTLHVVPAGTGMQCLLWSCNALPVVHHGCAKGCGGHVHCERV
jgi:hypothetical protein